MNCPRCGSMALITRSNTGKLYCGACGYYPIYAHVDLQSDREKINHAFEQAKEIVKSMDGLSEEGFKNRYLNDPHFNKSFTALVCLAAGKNAKSNVMPE